MEPLLSVTYCDPEHGVRGWLVIDTLVGGAAAGGLRIAPDLDRETIVRLARNMTKKQRAVGIRIGGAKAGLAMAPDAPFRGAVLRRFMATLAPLVGAMWSVGPDVNTTMAELEGIARALGLPSLKLAVAKSRGLDAATFLARYALFEAPIAGATLNQVRGAVATFAAVEVLLARLGARDGAIAIQGAGNMGAALARLLVHHEVVGPGRARVVAWADERRCLADPEGLDVPAVLAAIHGGRLPPGAGAAPREAVLAAPCDVLVLAAVSRALGPDDVARVGARTIVEAANLALAPEIEEALFARGVVVAPDLIASAGGSLSVEALYEGAPASPEDVVAHVRARAAERLAAAFAEAEAAAVSPCTIVARWAATPDALTPDAADAARDPSPVRTR